MYMQNIFRRYVTRLPVVGTDAPTEWVIVINDNSELMRIEPVFGEFDNRCGLRNQFVK